MDHVDWLGEAYVKELAATLAQQVLPGGIVIWRSASLNPPYAQAIADAGFAVTCLQRASDGYMDRWGFQNLQASDALVLVGRGVGGGGYMLCRQELAVACVQCM
jgi:hypothetical protein